jgi:hypothetical protein
MFPLERVKIVMFETLEAKTAGVPLAYPTFEVLYGARPIGRLPQQKSRKQNRPLLSILALGTLALCLSLIAVALHQRQKVAEFFPSIAPLYARIGLPVNLLGLEIRSIKAQILTEGAYSVLAIEGQLANVKKQSQIVPALQIAIKAPDGQQIYQWMAEAPKSHLNANEVTYFRARLTAPPDQADKVTIEFSEIGNNSPAKLK